MFSNLHVKILIHLVLTLVLSACASFQAEPVNPDSLAYYPATGEDSLAMKFCPVFLVEEADKPYNRIGTPVALDSTGTIKIRVDPEQPSIYFQTQNFSTPRGSYTNLIYRIHFEKIPLGILPIHLAAGKNPGIFTIVTLNSELQPVLFTTVHTCGCYLTIMPTSYLPTDSWPDNWAKSPQFIYGETLPGLLEFPPDHTGHLCLVIRIRGATHRVMDVAIIPAEDLQEDIPKATVSLKAMRDLYELPAGDQKIPFFYMDGWKKGYVKNSGKPLEILLMSWWAFDPFIGQDKALGPSHETGTTFYTSLKFWDREDSDLWDFASFLNYWGWKL